MTGPGDPVGVDADPSPVEGEAPRPDRAEPGVPDGIDRLWQPDRMAYIQGENRPRTGEAGPDCPFCRAPEAAPDDGLVVARGQHVFVVLNLYPYNTGHLMVCPYRHVADYADLTEDETTELASFTQQAMRVLRVVFGPQGFNIGMNQGAVGGAGIAMHLHQHVVPRWGGDTNFMPVVARTKVLPQLLPDTRRRLADAWAAAERRSPTGRRSRGLRRPPPG